MHSNHLQILGLGQTRASQSGLWALLIGGLGLSLWAQVFYLPLSDELRFAEPSMLRMLAYLAPLAALLVGGILRAGFLTLLAFTVAFVPGILWLSPSALSAIEQPWSMVRIGVTLAAYVATAAAGVGPTQTLGRRIDGAESAVSKPQPTRRVDGVYPFYFALRGLLLFALLFVIQYAIFRDPVVAQKLAQSYPTRPEAAATFIGIFSFFAWCVAAYSLFFVPLMNLEYAARRLEREVNATLETPGRARRLRVALWGGLAILASATGWFLNFVI
ncbi:hypothetical protein [Bradymonas sediminis]|uniref:Uncharacterized protein n=1 Tax=Bradymonas sediminis TaxID=1548548 RepID=A0A2Z4FKD0_9DELT|nr:hypothetical protein [Bradymonas sediminis]AWV89409.1 hypothetical protein DN745_08690 [Bradymonas sediminis]TDP73591.1 hypothetical protein DFR33_106235 [Bradymonas sediminis]